MDDTWDSAAQRRWDLFLGSENYDNRIDNGGLLDLEVLADLRLRYGPRPMTATREGCPANLACAPGHPRSGDVKPVRGGGLAAVAGTDPEGRR